MKRGLTFSRLGGPGSVSKLRPALVIASTGRGDWICAQITSNPYADTSAVQIKTPDFAEGDLGRVSFVRPGKLFTANESLFRRTAAKLRRNTFETVLEAIIQVLRGSTKASI